MFRIYLFSREDQIRTICYKRVYDDYISIVKCMLHVIRLLKPLFFTWFVRFSFNFRPFPKSWIESTLMKKWLNCDLLSFYLHQEIKTNYCTHNLFNIFSNFSRQKHWSQSHSLHGIPQEMVAYHQLRWSQYLIHRI